jgi:DnaJ-class molecular chaperone
MQINMAKIIKKAIKKVQVSSEKEEKVCPDCNGTGLRDENTLCPTCQGTGKV